MVKRWAARAAAIAVLVMAGMAWGKMMVPELAPVERLIKNTEAYVKEHPKDASGYYTLGRIHYLAFAQRAAEVGAFNRGSEDGKELPAIPERGFPVGRDDKGKALGDEELAGHLKGAVENFRLAIGLSPKNATYHLGLASVLEAGAGQAAALAEGWKREAVGEYLTAYKLAEGKDSKIETEPLWGIQSLVSYEAGKAYVRLVGERAMTKEEKEQVAAIEAQLAALAKKPPGPISPIVFDLSGAKPLEALLSPGVRVRFDLDGTGRGTVWPWVKPTTGILVWDPKHTGRVASGRQLFGSVTWWVIWPDGYRALDALDDNRDGELSGEELAGLGVWYDWNGNGVCDPGEVVAIEKTGIQAISCRATGMTGKSPMNAGGVRVECGRVLPTYDWTTRPAGE